VRRKKLPKVRLHDLRHSHATIALAAGTDLKTIIAALGHSTIAVTANTYLHATEAMQRTHAERLGLALGASVAKKKPLHSNGFHIAPTGFEPVLPP
jgi:integrase